MGENSNERAERRVWTAGLVDEQAANVRVLGPGQDAAATALAGDLLQMAEQALQDRPMAERIVTAILRNQSQLVTTATRSVTPGQREAAHEALARAVRRAVLDALPPVIQTPLTDRGGRDAAPGVARARKLRAPQGGGTQAKEASFKGPPSKATPSKSPQTIAVADTDSARLPAARGAAGGARRRGVIIVLGLLAALCTGFAVWHFVLQPMAEQAAPAADTAGVPSLASTTSLAEAETLQLESVEPSGGQLRPSVDGGVAPSATDDDRPTATPIETTPSRLIDMGTVAALDAAPPPDGIALPPGAGDLRIFILYPEGDPAAAEAGAVYAALSRTGELPLVVLRDVGFAIASPRIRYFYAADAAAARALADFLDAPEGGWTLQDFGHIRPLPAPGTVEIYVPSP